MPGKYPNMSDFKINNIPIVYYLIQAYTVCLMP